MRKAPPTAAEVESESIAEKPKRSDTQVKNAHRRKNATLLKARIKELTKQKEEAEEDAKRARTTTGMTLVSPLTHEETGANLEARVNAIKELFKSLAGIF